MKKFIIVIFAVVIALALSFSYSFYKNAPPLDDRISCYAQIRYNYAGSEQHSQLSSGIYIYLSQGKGVVDFSGEIAIGEKKYRIKRNAEVSYNPKDASVYLLKTVKLNINPVDNVPIEIARKHMYSYLTREDGWINFGVYPNANNGYVFSTTAIPQFLCKKL
ncbi:Uncharacterised protein [Yersinia massiliensis]|uniref:hypothetical protein n=1 Tax=Yersinia massiliensis TaxID=419257 RepID=UPI0005E82A27|nr:hypothetical protein [Yersinia massiliensis]CNH65662.1 Uncharacterised protein [Yersinia massiliensis]